MSHAELRQRVIDFVGPMEPGEEVVAAFPTAFRRIEGSDNLLEAMSTTYLPMVFTNKRVFFLSANRFDKPTGITRTMPADQVRLVHFKKRVGLGRWIMLTPHYLTFTAGGERFSIKMGAAENKDLETLMSSEYSALAPP